MFEPIPGQPHAVVISPPGAAGDPTAGFLHFNAPHGDATPFRHIEHFLQLRAIHIEPHP